MTSVSTRRDFVADQYSDSERLRVRIETHRRYSEGTEWLVDGILAALKLQEGVRLLDVGCGPGEWHRALTDERVAVVAVNLMPGMLAEARAAGSAFQPRPMLAQGDAEALPLRSATFDRALCAGVLYHVPNCREALLELRCAANRWMCRDLDQWRRRNDAPVRCPRRGGASSATRPCGCLEHAATSRWTIWRLSRASFLLPGVTCSRAPSSFRLRSPRFAFTQRAE